MKVFKGIMAFWDLHTNVSIIKNGGWWQSVIDEYQIQVLQNYRTVAAFVIPLLIAVEEVDKNCQIHIRKIIDECEEILKDESIYVVVGKGNSKLSQKLSEAVEKASEAISHAGNLCNNLMPCLEGRISKKIFLLGLRARDMCDKAVRTVHFG